METFGRAVFGGLGRPTCSLRAVPTHRANAGLRCSLSAFITRPY